MHVQAAKERRGAVLEQNAAIAHVAARAALLDGSSGIAVELERNPESERLPLQQRQDGAVAPLGQNQVGIVAFEQMVKGYRGGLFAAIAGIFAAAYFDFEDVPADRH